VSDYLQPVREIYQPDREAFFAGQLDYSRLSLVEGALMKYAIKAPEGDFRDWDEIRAWAGELTG
jgi:menaquinone-dependent protoporphyrinogen IX oxidase